VLHWAKHDDLLKCNPYFLAILKKKNRNDKQYRMRRTIGLRYKSIEEVVSVWFEGSFRKAIAQGRLSNTMLSDNSHSNPSNIRINREKGRVDEQNGRTKAALSP